MFNEYNRKFLVTCLLIKYCFVFRQWTIWYLFYRYKSEDNLMNSEGVSNLFERLQITDEFTQDWFLWKAEISDDGTITEENFTAAFKYSEAVVPSEAANYIKNLVSEIYGDEQSFKTFYKWMYKFSFASGGNKNLSKEVSIALWRTAFSERDCVFLDKWINYLQANKNIKFITNDQWGMFLEFWEEFEEGDFSAYNDGEHYPSLFDEFVTLQVGGQN